MHTPIAAEIMRRGPEPTARAELLKRADRWIG